MYRDKNFKLIYNSIVEFTDKLEEHVISTQQVNSEERLYRIYANYEINLKNIFQNLQNCKKDQKQCIDNMKDDFEKLRSDIAKSLEKLK